VGNCDHVKTDRKLAYIRVNSPTKRTWKPVGFLCEKCGKLVQGNPPE